MLDVEGQIDREQRSTYCWKFGRQEGPEAAAATGRHDEDGPRAHANLEGEALYVQIQKRKN